MVNNTIPLDSKTILLQGYIQDILRKTNTKTRRGVDIRLYQVCDGGNNDKDAQTVATFLSSMHNPSRREQKDKQDVERLISEELDRIILSDRVRSCNDYYKTNNKKSFDNKMMVG